MYRHSTSGPLAILALLWLAAPAGIRAQTSTFLEGTSHDFSLVMGSTSDGCAICHIAGDSGGNKGGAEEPLLYAFATSSYGTEEMGQESLLCLSCHDGVSAPSTGGFGPSGSGSHPISAAYLESDRGLRSVQEVESAGLYLMWEDGGYRVECTSCHTPHDNSNGYFLRVSNERSALCLTCHVK